MFFIKVVKCFKFFFHFLMFFYCCVFVGVKNPHTNMMIFLQQTAVSLFLICNIQFSPVFIDYSEGVIEWGGGRQ